MQFPFLPADANFDFPPPSEGSSLVAVGGNLSPGMLLSAYRRGIFPWYDDDDGPVFWHSPDPRCVLFPSDLHITKKFSSFAKKQDWSVSLDRDFKMVIDCCAHQSRKGQNGTWITENVQQAYIELHRLGFAHSCEVYNEEDQFIGGLYGLQIGRIFFGESMVSLESQASRYAFTHFVNFFEQKKEFHLIDCQQETPYLVSMGAKTIPRESFLQQIEEHIALEEAPKSWATYLLDFPKFSLFG